MAILKLTKPVSGEFECEYVPPDSEGKPSDQRYRFVRPCERYEELEKACKSISGRVNQYYVYGELIDCKQHLANYKSCMRFRRERNLELLEPIIAWEQNLIETRMNTVEQNKAWTARDSPPENFDKPLPEFITKRHKSSLFHEFKSNR